MKSLHHALEPHAARALDQHDIAGCTSAATASAAAVLSAKCVTAARARPAATAASPNARADSFAHRDEHVDLRPHRRAAALLVQRAPIRARAPASRRAPRRGAARAARDAITSSARSHRQRIRVVGVVHHGDAGCERVTSPRCDAGASVAARSTIAGSGTPASSPTAMPASTFARLPRPSSGISHA